MVDYRDRRSDRDDIFNVVTPGDDEHSRWSGMPHDAGRKDVASFFKGQQNTPEWGEANRLAKRRTDHEFRQSVEQHTDVTEDCCPTPSASDYANSYAGHLNRVVGDQARQIQGKYHRDHPASGYGRT